MNNESNNPDQNESIRPIVDISNSNFNQNTTTNSNEPVFKPEQQVDTKNKSSNEIIRFVLTIVIFFISAFLYQIFVIFIPGLHQRGPGGFSVPNNYGSIFIIFLAITTSVIFYRSRK